jgi:hypothetical protein
MQRVKSVAVIVLTLVVGLHARPSWAGTAGASSDPCSDPRFKAAELAAYQKLVKAQEEIARVLEIAITALEKISKENLAQEDDRYRQALLKCNGGAACIQNLNDYHKTQPPHILWNRDSDLRTLRADEAAAMKRAKDDYDNAVEDARQRYCGEEPSSKANAKKRAAEQRRVQQALTRLLTYATTIR